MSDNTNPAPAASQLKPFYTPPPGATLKLHPFTAHHPQADIDRLKRKLDDVEEIRTTYENSYAPDEYAFGIKKDWVEGMLYDWRAMDWRKTEDEINSFPNYTTTLSTRGHTFTIHFVALFSENPDAVPVIFTHGWPGSFLEFLPLLTNLRSTYTPHTLPIHAIVPSLVGFGYSSPPPRHDRFSNADTAALWDGLMLGLGFGVENGGKGYVAQGGDVGSFVARLLGERYEACRAIHVNMMRPPPGATFKADPSLGDDDLDAECIDRLKYFLKYEFAYRDEHATKPATIGMVVESSPVALLTWIGEKTLRWSDTPPTPSQILDNITLYYLTHTFPTSLYHYWNSTSSAIAEPSASPDNAALKAKGTPVGYSLFKKEIVPVPIRFVREDVNLVWSRRHDKGGHFAAWEQPEALLQDVLDFVGQVWTK